ncbi:hypothetical protein D3C81_1467530 [compost metagenome]
MNTCCLIPIFTYILMSSGINQIHYPIQAVINDAGVVNKPAKNIVPEAVNHDYHFAILHLETSVYLFS